MKRTKILTILLVTILVVGLGIPTTTHASGYSGFFKSFNKGAKIPLVSSKTKDAWVPQGMEYLPSKNWMLFTYYWKPEGTKAVALAVVDMKTNKHIKTVYLYESAKVAHKGHGSGVTVSKNHIWLASTGSKKGNVFKFKINDLVKAKNGGKLVATKSYKLKAASYTTYYDNKLWVGKYANGSSGLCSPNKNGGVIYSYKLNSKEDIVSTTPTSTWKTPDRVQGAAITSNRIIYSQSCGRNNNSTLYSYTKGSKGKQVFRITAPPMTEEIAIAKNKLYVNFESGAKEYRNGKKPLYNVYFTNVSTFK